MKRSQLIQNIEAVLLEASNKEIQSGLDWYKNAHDSARSISIQSRQSLGKIVYCIAALSPRNSWERNLIDCSNLSQHLTLDVKVGTFNANKQKALECLLSENFDFNFYPALDRLSKGGFKTKAFAKLIYNPEDEYTVCVDTHAIGVAHNNRYTSSDEDKKLLGQVFKSEDSYESICDAYRAVANKHGWLPHQVQAITWVTWKRIHGV
jgi:hypothetical protein